MDIKVFQMNECDWMAGESEEQVKKAYKEQTGLSDEEINEDFVGEVGLDTGWRWAEIVDLEELKDAAFARKGELVVRWIQGSFCFKQTFEEALRQDMKKGQQIPYVIASTEV